ATRSGKRRSSTGCSTAMVCRRLRSGSRASCCGGAPTTGRCAWSRRGRCCLPWSPSFSQSPPPWKTAASFAAKGGPAELGLHVCVGLAMTIGLEHIRERTHSAVHNIGALLIAGLTLFAVIFGLGIGANPLVTGEPVGGLFLNLILLGYGLPAVLAIVL